MRGRIRLVSLLGAAVVLGAAAPAWAGATERVSVSSGGIQSDRRSLSQALSADGRFVAFASRADNLVAGDTNGVQDIFVRDRKLGVTERISVGAGGAQGDRASYEPSISADGRFVAFFSYASNLVPGDTNGTPCPDKPCGSDVFVRDRELGTTERVSVGAGGDQGNDSSYDPAISRDGRFVAFDSVATNLVPGDTNGADDVFVRDRLKGTTERASISSTGAQGNNDSGNEFGQALSADGRFVAFQSYATNLARGDANGTTDIFVRDRKLGTTERVSVGPGGVQGDAGSIGPALSADGRFVAFQSEASNLVAGDTNDAEDVFVRDRKLGTTERVSVGTGGGQGGDFSSEPSISADGRFVAFTSDAADLVPGDANGARDVFVRDRLKGTTERVSVSSSGKQGNRASCPDNDGPPTISANGRVVAYASKATNLVPGDTNRVADIFVRSR